MDALFPWLKGVHVASFVVWLGAMLTTAVLLGLAREPALRERLAPLARRVYTRVQVVGMGLTLATGITQMVLYMQAVPAWMKTNTWIHWKLMFVFAIAVVDHIIMRRVLALKRKPEQTPKPVYVHLAVVVLFALVAIFLATVQPTR